MRYPGKSFDWRGGYDSCCQVLHLTIVVLIKGCINSVICQFTEARARLIPKVCPKIGCSRGLAHRRWLWLIGVGPASYLLTASVKSDILNTSRQHLLFKIPWAWLRKLGTRTRPYDNYQCGKQNGTTYFLEKSDTLILGHCSTVVPYLCLSPTYSLITNSRHPSKPNYSLIPNSISSCYLQSSITRQDYAFIDSHSQVIAVRFLRPHPSLYRLKAMVWIARSFWPTRLCLLSSASYARKFWSKTSGRWTPGCNRKSGEYVHVPHNLTLDEPAVWCQL